MNVYIMSGPPGSGKSYEAELLAQAIVETGDIGSLVSTDHMHCPDLEKIQPDPYCGIPLDMLQDEDIQAALKNYQFDAANLTTAHPKCMKAVIDWHTMWKINSFHLIIDNTNIHNWEINPYYLIAQAFGVDVEILRVETPLDVCLSRQIHGMPEQIITQMHETFSEMITHPFMGQKRPKQHMPWWVSRSI